jgi:hypothetical protein
VKQEKAIINEEKSENLKKIGPKIFKKYREALSQLLT